MSLRLRSLSLSLESSAVEQVLDILMDVLSWEIAEVVSPCLPRGLWSLIVIRVFLLISTVCLRHPPYPVLPSCPLSRAFPHPQPGDVGGHRSAPAICQSRSLCSCYLRKHVQCVCVCVSNPADSRLVWYGAALGALVAVVLVVIDNAVAKQPLLRVMICLFMNGL